jgi:hypothetical protein
MDSFSITLSRLRDMINSRLRPDIDKVWLQGVNAGNARLVFTIFYNDNRQYTMRFMDVKNFRHFRPDGDQENEMRLLEAYMVQFVRVLGDVLQ